MLTYTFFTTLRGLYIHYGTQFRALTPAFVPLILFVFRFRGPVLFLIFNPSLSPS